MKLILKILCLLFFVYSLCIADQRNFVWTYEYKTVEKGSAEIESYFTNSVFTTDESKRAITTEHQIELEVGMTDNFDFAVYQQFEQKTGVDEFLKYKGYKLRARYKIGVPGQYFLNPLIYLEYKGNNGFDEHKIESKLILAKETESFLFALNPMLEFEYEENKLEIEFEYAIGIGHKLHELIRIGLELKGSEDGNYIGPTISHGTEDLWVTLGPSFGVGKILENEPNFKIRLLIGVHL